MARAKMNGKTGLPLTAWTDDLELMRELKREEIGGIMLALGDISDIYDRNKLNSSADFDVAETTKELAEKYGLSVIAKHLLKTTINKNLAGWDGITAQRIKGKKAAEKRAKKTDTQCDVPKVHQWYTDGTPKDVGKGKGKGSKNPCPSLTLPASEWTVSDSANGSIDLTEIVEELRKTHAIENIQEAFERTRRFCIEHPPERGKRTVSMAAKRLQSILEDVEAGKSDDDLPKRKYKLLDI